jgi:hypothetical protein
MELERHRERGVHRVASVTVAGEGLSVFVPFGSMFDFSTQKRPTKEGPG